MLKVFASLRLGCGCCFCCNFSLPLCCHAQFNSSSTTDLFLPHALTHTYMDIFKLLTASKVRDTHSQALRIRRECANCIALCAVRMYVWPGVRAPLCVFLCMCVRFNNHCNCCWLAFFIICKPMYPAFYCQAAARPRPLQAQLQLNQHIHTHTSVYPVHLLMHAAP